MKRICSSPSVIEGETRHVLKLETAADVEYARRTGRVLSPRIGDVIELLLLDGVDIGLACQIFD